MKRFVELSRVFLKDDEGQDLIEYALVSAIIGLGTISAIGSLATAIGNGLISIGTSLASAV